MNDADDWDKVGQDYATDVFNVFKNDKKGILKKMVLSHGNKTHSAIDFGCGIGNALPMLSPLFKEVHGIDVSKNLIEIAKKHGFKNVSFEQADLAEKSVKLPKSEFLLCCNVTISADNVRNFQMLRNAMNALNPGGTAIFVLPSLESISFATWLLLNMYQKEGVKIPDIPISEIHNLSAEFHHHFKDGIVGIDNIPTKHYLLTEIIAFFNAPKFEVQTIDRIEYDWETELDEKPKNVKAPYPWDWMVEVKRVG